MPHLKELPITRGPVYTPLGSSSSGAGASSGSITTREPNIEPAKKGRGLNLALNIGGGLSLNLAIGHQGKYPNGSSVEVLRTDGEWSLAVVKDYDWRGVTYACPHNPHRPVCAQHGSMCH